MMPKKVSILLSALSPPPPPPLHPRSATSGLYRQKPKPRKTPHPAPPWCPPSAKAKKERKKPKPFSSHSISNKPKPTYGGGKGRKKGRVFCPTQGPQPRTVAHGGQGCRYEGRHCRYQTPRRFLPLAYFNNYAQCDFVVKS